MICSADKCCGRANVSSAMSIRWAVGNTPRSASSAVASSRVIDRYHRNQRLGSIPTTGCRDQKQSRFRCGLARLHPRRPRVNPPTVACNQEGRMRTLHGFTLWELLCTLSIAAITLTAGVPAFRSFLLDSRLTADVNGWVLAVQLARSEAFKRGRPVLACKTDQNWGRVPG